MSIQLPPGFKWETPPADEAPKAQARPALPDGFKWESAAPSIAEPPSFTGAMAKGFKRSLPETKSLLAGAGAAAAGAVGLDGVRDKLLDTYQGIQQTEVAPLQSKTGFIDAVTGDGSLKEWAGDTLGNFGGQAVQSLAAAGAGALVGSAVPGAGTVAGGVGGLLFKAGAKEMVTDAVGRMVAKGVAKDVAEKTALRRLGGAAIAGTGLNVGQEVGIGFTGRAEDAAAAGEQLNQQDALRAIGYGIPAGLVDTAAEALTGSRLMQGVSDSPKMLRRMAKGAGIGAVSEGATEGVQAVLERAGAARGLTGEEAYRDYIENAAAGALGGGVAGAGGGFRRQQDPAAPPPETEQQQVPPEVSASQAITPAPNPLATPPAGPLTRAAATVPGAAPLATPPPDAAGATALTPTDALPPLIADTAAQAVAAPTAADPVFEQAKQLLGEAGKVQRGKLAEKLGLNRNQMQTLLDQLHAAGIVGPSNGKKPRALLVNPITGDVLDPDEKARLDRKVQRDAEQKALEEAVRGGKPAAAIEAAAAAQGQQPAAAPTLTRLSQPPDPAAFEAKMREKQAAALTRAQRPDPAAGATSAAAAVAFDTGAAAIAEQQSAQAAQEQQAQAAVSAQAEADKAQQQQQKVAEKAAKEADKVARQAEKDRVQAEKTAPAQDVDIQAVVAAEIEAGKPMDGMRMYALAKKLNVTPKRIDEMRMALAQAKKRGEPLATPPADAVQNLDPIAQGVQNADTPNQFVEPNKMVDQYDDSPDVTEDDITPPSGGAFSIRSAAESTAKRTPGGKVFEVDGGFVVRTPRVVVNQELTTAAPSVAEFVPATLDSKIENGYDVGERALSIHNQVSKHVGYERGVRDTDWVNDPFLPQIREAYAAGTIKTEQQTTALYLKLLNNALKAMHDKAVVSAKAAEANTSEATGKESLQVAPAPASATVKESLTVAAAKPKAELAADVAGEQLDDKWTAFAPETGTLNVPRADMPQVKSEHRGAMVQFLAARGITHEQAEVPAASLKPTQAEFSAAKVKKALKRAAEGEDRAILVSADGHVLDGHHQWLAKREAGASVKVIRLDAPIAELLQQVKEFPSSTQAKGATAPTGESATPTQPNQTQLEPTNAKQEAPRTEQAAPAGQAAEKAKPEALLSEPAKPSGAMQRQRMPRADAVAEVQRQLKVTKKRATEIVNEIRSEAKNLDGVTYNLKPGIVQTADVQAAIERERAAKRTEAKPAGFDSERFDKARKETIDASREAGNKHLDTVPASVETMRAYTIYDVHNPSNRGVVDTVDNNGNVYVLWENGTESSLGRSDMKDYAFTRDARLDAGALKKLRKAVETRQNSAQAAKTEANRKQAVDAVDRMQSTARELRPLIDKAMAGTAEQKDAAEAYLDGQIDEAELRAVMAADTPSGAVATHKDPGQPAEPVTAPVITEAIKTSASKTPLNLKEARAWLLERVDEALKGAPKSGANVTVSDPRTEDGRKVRDVSTDVVDPVSGASRPRLRVVEIKVADSGNSYNIMHGNKVLDRQDGSLRFAILTAENLLLASKWQPTGGPAGSWDFTGSAPADFVTFDVPGDGKFKVLNTRENLEAFRAKVVASSGFKDERKRTAAAPMAKSEAWTVINSFLEDAEFGNAYTYSNAVDKPLRYALGKRPDGAAEDAVQAYAVAEDVEISGFKMWVGRLVALDGAGTGIWTVVEPTTGRVLGSAGSRDAAIGAARALAKKHGDKWVADKIKSEASNRTEAQREQDWLKANAPDVYALVNGEEEQEAAPVAKAAKPQQQAAQPAPAQPQDENAKPAKANDVDARYEHLLSLKSTRLMDKHSDGRALYEVTLSMEQRKALQDSRGQFIRSVSFEIKSKEDVTGKRYDAGYVLIDRREQNANRAALEAKARPVDKKAITAEDVASAVSAANYNHKGISFSVAAKHAEQVSAKLKKAGVPGWAVDMAIQAGKDQAARLRPGDAAKVAAAPIIESLRKNGFIKAEPVQTTSPTLAEAKKNEPLTEWALQGFIKIAADSVQTLRPVDVERVIRETPAQHRQAVAEYIKKNSYGALDLEVDDVARELGVTMTPVAPDLKGFKLEQTDSAAFDLVDGNMRVSVVPMADGKFQASYRGAKSSPHLQSKQAAIDWAAGYRDEAKRLAAPASSVQGQKNMAARGGRIATLMAMNGRLRKLDPDSAWLDSHIEQADDLDALQDQISEALTKAERGKQPTNALRSELEQMSGAELRVVFDRMSLAGARMTHIERVEALMAEDEAAVRAAMAAVQPEATTGPADAKGERKFYVTMIRDSKVARIAGPFDTKEEADAILPAARDKAKEVDPRAVFDAFGVSAVTMEEHKPAALNEQLGIGKKAPSSKPAAADNLPTKFISSYQGDADYSVYIRRIGKDVRVGYDKDGNFKNILSEITEDEKASARASVERFVREEAAKEIKFLEERGIDIPAELRAKAGQVEAAAAPTIPEGYKPTGEPYYVGKDLVQGYAKFPQGERVKLASGIQGVVTGHIGKGPILTRAMVKFDNGTESGVDERELVAVAAAKQDDDAPTMTRPEARELMFWQDMGQKDGEKSHRLTFYTSKDDAESKRGSMTYGKITKDQGSSKWFVEDGDSFTSLADAKRQATEMALDRAEREGFIAKDAPAKQEAQAKATATPPQAADFPDAASYHAAVAAYRAANPATPAAPKQDRRAEIKRELAALQQSYEKRMNRADGAVPPAIKADALAGIARKMDKLTAELKALDEAKATPAKPGAITDFGEKLPPARRAMAAKLDEALTDADIANRPLSEIWPIAENEAIEDTFAAAVAHAARAEIPAKPRKGYKVTQWVAKVKIMRDLAASLVSGRTDRDTFISAANKRAATVPSLAGYDLRDWISKVLLLEQIDRSQWKRISEVESRPDMKVKRGDAWVSAPQLRIVIDDKPHYLNGDNGAAEPATVAGNMAGILGLMAKDAQSKALRFEIRGSGGRFYIAKKDDPEIRQLMTFTSVEDARKAITEQYDSLVAAWQAIKDRDNITERDLRGEENRPRVGKDHRKGRDVKPEDFQEKFGFKGGEFGKWVQQGKGDKDRQTFLNNAYDSLMDLAELAGIPPRAISLNGTLGIAFGSRGSGWASAHFEPSNLVINLTKTRGAGALAHEWFHALDNYFSRLRGGEVKFAGSNSQYRSDNYITHNPEPLMVRKDGSMRYAPMTRGKLEATHAARKHLTDAYNPDNWKVDPKHREGVRPEVEARFADLVQALNDSPMTKRSAKLDKGKSNYWSSTLERAARAFEIHVIARLAEQGNHNDFLANVNQFDEMAGKGEDRYPYLLPGEVKPIADAFDALFNTVQTRTEPSGNVAMFAKSGEPQQFSPATARAWQALAEIPGTFQRPRTDAKSFEDITKAILPDAEVVEVDDGATITVQPMKDDQGNVARDMGTTLVRVEYVRTSGGVGIAPTDIGRGTLVGYTKDGKEAFSTPVNGRADVVTEFGQEVADRLLAQSGNAGRSAGLNTHVRTLTGVKVNPLGKPKAVTMTILDSELAMDASQLQEGVHRGSALYSIALAYAHNNGVVFIPDPADVSEAAMQRRGEHMLSSALKYGTTRHMVPDPEQGLDWREGDDQHNVLELIRASADNVVDNVPDLQAIDYDWDSGRFIAADGRTFTRDDFKALAESTAGRAARAGVSTLRRGVVSRSLERRAGTPAWRGVVTRLLQLGRAGLLGSQLEGILYARGADGARGMPADKLTRLLATAKQAMALLGVNIEVVANGSDLPAEITAQDDYDDTVQAAITGDRKTVYFVASRIASPRAAIKLVAHELVGHMSMEQLLGKRWPELRDAILRLRDNGKWPEVFAEVSKRYERNADGTFRPLDDATFAAEAIAVFAERNIQTSILQRAVNSVRAWLRRLGFAMDMSQGELRQMLWEAGQKLEGRAYRPGVVDDVLGVKSEPKQMSMREAVERHSFSRTTDRDPFYSALLRSIEEAKGAPKKADGAAWRQWLDGAQRRGEIKQSEREWVGVDAWLDGQQATVTREALAEFVRANAVQVREVVLNEKSDRLAQLQKEFQDQGFGFARVYGRQDDSGDEFQEVAFTDDDGNEIDFRELPKDLQQRWRAASDYKADAKFSSYQLPGGQNYRELLLTMPSKEQYGIARRVAEGDVVWVVVDANGKTAPGTPAFAMEKAAREEARAMNAEHKTEAYNSSHWQQPNILAHVRFNERVDADGKRVLFVEEIQSDWHQDGRKLGYRTRKGTTEVPRHRRAVPENFTVQKHENPNTGYTSFEARHNSMPNTPVAIAATSDAAVEKAIKVWEEHLAKHPNGFEDIENPAVPDAPLKKEWPLTAMKRMLRYAAENGFDRVAWTTGKQQNERYPDGGELNSKIAHGMQAFYDQMLPNELGKYVKRWGAKVGTVMLDTGRTARAKAGLTAQQKTDIRDLAKSVRSMDDLEVRTEFEAITGVEMTDEQAQDWRDLLRDPSRRAEATAGVIEYADTELKGGPVGVMTQPSIDITPAMRQAAMEGQALFAKPGTIVDRLQEAINPKDTTLLQRLKDKLSDWRPAALGALQLRHLGELAERILPPVAMYSGVVQRMATMRNELQELGHDVVEAGMKYQGKNQEESKRLFKLLHDATLAGVDPSGAHQPLRMMAADYRTNVDVTDESVRAFVKLMREQAKLNPGSAVSYINRVKEARKLLSQERKRRVSHRELAPKFAHMSADGQALWAQMRDAYKLQTDEYEKALISRIQSLNFDKAKKAGQIARMRLTFESARVPFYVPLARWGQFWVSGTNSEGQREFFMQETQGDQKRVIKELEKSGYLDIGHGVKLDTVKAQDGASASFMADMDEMLTESGAPEKIRDEAFQLYLRSLPDLSMRKNFIHRAGTPGYSQDAVRALAGHIFHGSFQIARLRYSHELEGLRTEAEDMARDMGKAGDPDANAAGNIVNELKKRHEWVMNPQDNALVNKISSIGFVYYLGLTPAAALVNLLQTPMVALPILAGKHKLGAATRELMRAMKESMSTYGHMQTKLEGEELEAHKEFARRGVFDKSQAHNMAGISESDTHAYSPKWHKTMTVISHVFHKAEVVNRESTAMAAYRLERASGAGHIEAVEAADRAVHESQFDYSNANRARYMQSGAAKVLLMFRQYSLAVTWLLGRNMYQALKGEDAATRKEAQRKLAGILGMTAIFSGTLGLPIIGTVGAVLNAVAAAFGDDDEPWDWETEFRAFLREMLGETGAEAVLRGPVQAATGVGIASRVSMGDLWFREPDRELEGRAWSNYLFEQAAGPMGGLITNFFRAQQLMGEGQVWRGVETMMPKAIKDAMKSVRYLDEGVNNLRGDAIVEDLNVMESLAQVMGFSPASVSNVYDMQRDLKGYEDFIERRRSRLMDAYALAWRLGDKEAQTAVIEKMQAFSRTYPQWPITSDSIRTSLQSRARGSAQAELGIIVNPKLRGMLEQRLALGTP